MASKSKSADTDEINETVSAIVEGGRPANALKRAVLHPIDNPDAPVEFVNGASRVNPDTIEPEGIIGIGLVRDANDAAILTDPGMTHLQQNTAQPAEALAGQRRGAAKPGKIEQPKAGLKDTAAARAQRKQEEEDAERAELARKDKERLAAEKAEQERIEQEQREKEAAAQA
jgi:hypothetical protein